MKLLLTLSVIAASIAIVTAAHASDLQVRITGLRSANGTILIDLHNDPAAFPRDAAHAFLRARIPVTGLTVGYTFKDIPAGIYAFTYLVDENDDGKLDTGAFGIPKEGIGFSRDPRFTLSAPSFQDAAINVEGRNSVEVSTVKYY